jgi:hypothetical protein
MVVNPPYLLARLVWFAIATIFFFFFGLHVTKIHRNFEIAVAESKFWPKVGDDGFPIVPLTILVPLGILYFVYHFERVYPTVFVTIFGVILGIVIIFIFAAVLMSIRDNLYLHGRTRKYIRRIERRFAEACKTVEVVKGR